MSSAHGRLLADIGGTHARFAWQSRSGAPLTDELTVACDDHPSLAEAITHYLRHSGGRAPAACAIGIATPVGGDRITMTNRDWSFSQSDLQRALGVNHLRILNDFEALALALPLLAPDELAPVGGGPPVTGAARAVLGPGTGLGVASLVSGPGTDLAVAGEGGHVTLAAADEEEAEVIRLLRHRFSHVSAERVLSGPGLLNLHAVACAMDGTSATLRQAAEVVHGALPTAPGQTPDPRCARALDWFFAFLGTVAGNLALTVGARAGVYIGGGIVPRLLPALRQSRFRERFEAKGRYRSYLASIPVWVIDSAASPALRGAARALDQILPKDTFSG